MVLHLSVDPVSHGDQPVAALLAIRRGFDAARIVGARRGRRRIRSVILRRVRSSSTAPTRGANLSATRFADFQTIAAPACFTLAMHTPREDEGSTATHRVPFVLIGFDRELRVCEWNRARRAAVRPWPPHARGRSIADLVPLAGRQLARPLDRPRRRRAGVAGATPTAAPWRWTVAPRAPGDGVADVVCYGADVTARAAATASTSELEHVMLRVLVDNLPVVVCAYASDGTYLYVGGQGLAATGLTSEQMVGKNPLEMFKDNSDSLRVHPPRPRRHPDAHDHRTARPLVGQLAHPAPPTSRAAMVSMSLDVTEAARAASASCGPSSSLIERQQRGDPRALHPDHRGVGGRARRCRSSASSTACAPPRSWTACCRASAACAARFAILDLTGIEVVDTAHRQPPDRR